MQKHCLNYFPHVQKGRKQKSDLRLSKTYILKAKGRYGQSINDCKLQGKGSENIPT